MMMNRLLELESDPNALEKFYRDAPHAFEEALTEASARRPDSPVFQVWSARLAFENAPSGVTSTERRRLVLVAVLVLLAGTLARLPDVLAWFNVDIRPDTFYGRNASLLVLPMLAAYFAHHFARTLRFVLPVAALVVASCIYINLLPRSEADTTILAMLHMPLWLWGLLGLMFTGTHRQHAENRLLFLRYNGEMLIYTALILIAGGILSGLTMALFHLIGIDVSESYMRTVGVYGLTGAPIVATLLATTRFGVRQRIAPIIARLFAPPALVTLVVYLGVMLTRLPRIFQDREMLAVLNLVLIAVLALIIFSISERERTSRFIHVVGLSLLAVAVLLDVVALSAIVGRLVDGLTPNRVAVLGANILILVHLALLLFRYVLFLTRRAKIDSIEYAVTWYLAVYVGWAALVTFGFPLFFGFV